MEENIPPGGQAQPSPSGGAKDILKTFSEILDQLPPIPEKWRTMLVKWYPWYLIILDGILGVFTALFIFGMSSLATIFSLGGFLLAGGGRSFLDVILILVRSGLGFAGGSMMLKRRKRGWELALLLEGINLVTHVISFRVTVIASSLFSIYLLWQIKKDFTS